MDKQKRQGIYQSPSPVRQSQRLAKTPAQERFIDSSTKNTYISLTADKYRINDRQLVNQANREVKVTVYDDPVNSAFQNLIAIAQSNTISGQRSLNSPKRNPQIKKSKSPSKNNRNSPSKLSAQKSAKKIKPHQ